MHAAEALTLAGEEAEVRAALLPRLKTETDHQRRCGLAREITRTGDRTVLGELWKILADEKSNGRVHAAESLYKIAEVGDGKLLRAAMAENDNLKLTLMAAAALGRGGNPAAMTRVRKELADDDREIRKIAASWAISRTSSRCESCWRPRPIHWLAPTSLTPWLAWETQTAASGWDETCRPMIRQFALTPPTSPAMPARLISVRG
jgi:sialidase-1